MMKPRVRPPSLRLEPARFGLVGTLVAGLSVLCACASEPERRALPISDDFSGECDWVEDDDEHISLGCDDGGYRALFKRTDERLHHVIFKRIEDPSHFVSVEADATLRVFPQGSSVDFQAHGVGCFASPAGERAQGYLFLVAPGVRSVALVRIDEEDESLREQFYFRALVDEESEHVAAVGGTNRIRGKCQAADDGVEVTMYVDGKVVGQVRDPKGFRPFEAFGLIVISSKGGTDVLFDNFKAEEIGEFG